MAGQVRGVNQLAKNLAKFDIETQKAIAGAVTALAEIADFESLPLIPLDTGALANSGRVLKAKPSHNPTARVRWGGAKAAYAAFVSEMDEATTNWTTPGTTSQWALIGVAKAFEGVTRVGRAFFQTAIKKSFPRTNTKSAGVKTQRLSV